MKNPYARRCWRWPPALPSPGSFPSRCATSSGACRSWLSSPLPAWRVPLERCGFAPRCCSCSAGRCSKRLHRPGPPPEIDAGAHEDVILDGCVVSPPAFFEGRDQFALLELAPDARARITLSITGGPDPARSALWAACRTPGSGAPHPQFSKPRGFRLRGILGAQPCVLDSIYFCGTPCHRETGPLRFAFPGGGLRPAHRRAAIGSNGSTPAILMPPR